MNNFDCSSTGINVELDCYRDNDLARIWFEDSFTCISRDSISLINERFRGVNILAYDQPNFELYSLENWKIPTKTELHGLILEKLFNGCSGTFDTETKDTFRKPSYKLSKAELLEFLSSVYEDDYKEFIVRNFKPKFKIVGSRGYRQGDYVEVVHMRTEDLNFDNELWDSPVSCRLTINEEEFYIDSEMKNLYDYDINEVKSIIEKLVGESNIQDKALAIKEAHALLPIEPEHRG